MTRLKTLDGNKFIFSSKTKKGYNGTSSLKRTRHSYWMLRERTPGKNRNFSFVNKVFNGDLKCGGLCVVVLPCSFGKTTTNKFFVIINSIFRVTSLLFTND